MRSGSFNISERDDKREQVSTILVNISVNEAVVFTSIFQLLAVLALLGRILGADWSENDVLIGWELVHYYRVRHKDLPIENVTSLKNDLVFEDVFNI